MADRTHPRLRAFLSFLPIAFLLMAVLGSIIIGFATPTEASATGAAGAIIIAAVYRKLNLKTLMDASLRTFGTMGMFGGIVIGAMCFTAIFNGLGGKVIIYDLIMGMDVPPVVILLTIVGICFVLGMFIDWVAILLVLLPTMLPIATAMGWDWIWFALVVCVTLQTAWLSPPFGYSLFFLRGLNLPGVTFTDIVIGAAPFMVWQLVGVGIIIAFPQVVLWLPNMLIK
jgi:TRAP-type mannitol/chloroaromatic compound transport system permease large subunit